MSRLASATPAAAIGLAACVLTIAADPQPGTAGHGRKIYEESGCARCHAASIEEDSSEGGLLRAGHPLEGAAYRGTWWSGRITTDAAEASEFCRKTFIDPNDEEGFSAAERKALVLFVQQLGAERGISPHALLRRDAGDVDLSAGEPSRGKELYRRACLACHGGQDPLRAEAEIAKMAGDFSPAQVADAIRRGKATMPFFQVDRLAAPQVADIAAYVESVRKAGAGPPR
jgi:mono/diheme cytochrome c family protein